ncbi:MAG TPA: MFS transporter [Pseudonocardia sp.]|nr:MFS transporter [Pseudonocardia sp.]
MTDLEQGASERSGAPARRRLRRAGTPLVVVSACVASVQMSWSLVVPVLPAYATQFGLGPAELGLVVGIFGVGRLLVNIPAGMLADRVDRRWLLLWSVLAVVVAQALTGLATGYGTLLATRLVTGIAGGVAITTGMSLLADVTTTASRGRDMATLQAFQLAGGSLGPVVGGLLAVPFGPRVPFFVSGMASVVVAVWAGRVLRGVTPGPAGPGDGPVRGRVRWFTRDVAGVCVLGSAVFFHRFGGLQSLVPLIAYGALGIGVAQMGLVLGGITLSTVLVVRLAGGLSDRWGRKRVIVPAMAVAGVGAAALAFSDSVAVFLVATLVTGVAAGFGGGAPAAYLADVAAPAVRGRSVGVYRTFGDVGTILGPVALGVAAEAWGYSAAALVLAGVVLASTAVFAALSRESSGPRRAPVFGAA